MATKISSFVFIIFSLNLQFLITQAADPDPLQNFCVIADSSSGGSSSDASCKASVTGTDFTSQLLRNKTSNNQPKSFVATLVDVSLFPALNTMGLSLARADLGPGGVVFLHAHPRSSELVYVQEGTIEAGFIDTSNTLYRHVLKSGDLMIFPRGLVHYQFNVGETAASLIAVFNSQDPGIQILGPSLFASQIPDEVLLLSMKLNRTTIDALRKIFAS